MSKVAIKCGAVEVEFEGSEEFIKEGFLDLVSDILELTNTTSLVGTSKAALPNQTSGPINMSVKSMGARLGISAGPDLAKAAAAFLTLAEQRETFTQQELLAAMKSATGIYKQSTHGKNIGKIISGLLSSNVLLQTATGTFALAEDQREHFTKVLNG